MEQYGSYEQPVREIDRIIWRDIDRPFHQDMIRLWSRGRIGQAVGITVNLLAALLVLTVSTWPAFALVNLAVAGYVGSIAWTNQKKINTHRQAIVDGDTKYGTEG